MRLPHTPESIEQMRERYHKALGVTVNVEAIENDKPGAYLPGDHRRHVFDFAEGVRWIVSRDRLGSREVIHASVSFLPKIMQTHPDPLTTLRNASELLGKIGDATIQREPDDYKVTEKGIYHFFWDM